MANEEERRLILEMIANGKITAEQGLNLLQSLPADEETTDEDSEPVFDDTSQPNFAALPLAAVPEELPPGAEQASSSESIPPVEPVDDTASDQASAAMPDFARWRRFWVIPLWIGVGITVISALLLFWAQQASGVGFWFFCAGVPFTLGIVLIVLAWQSRTARWLHLRVHQSPGERPQNIAISFPLPLRLSSWFLRTFHYRIPGMEGVSLDEAMSVLDKSTSPDQPLFIKVEEDDGERVEIYIG
jgi:SHOCT-like domain